MWREVNMLSLYKVILSGFIEQIWFVEYIISIDGVMTWKLSAMMSKFDGINSLSKMSELLRNFADFPILLQQWLVLLFATFYWLHRDSQKYVQGVIDSFRNLERGPIWGENTWMERFVFMIHKKVIFKYAVNHSSRWKTGVRQHL